MNAVTAAYQVRHLCQHQSALKREKGCSSSVLLDVQHCTLTNTCMQRAGPVWNASQKDRASAVSEAARAQWRVHNDLKREWSRVIDDALEILPWQIPKYSVAYSCSHVFLFICCSCLLLLHSHFFRCPRSFFFFFFFFFFFLHYN